MVAGLLLALMHALFSVTLRADQIVSGFAMTFLAAGITGFFYVSIYGTQGTPDDIPRAPDVTIPLLDDIPFIGDVLGRMNILIWLGLLTCLLTWLVVFRTPMGLRLRSVGENPLAAQTAGVSPVRVRYVAVAISGMLAAIGGAYLSIGFVGSFVENMTAGRGYIALAVLICGRWLPSGALVFACLFGFCSALAQRLPVFSESGRHAVPGAALRGDADRRGGRGRPVDPAGRDRPSPGSLNLCENRGHAPLPWIAPLLDARPGRLRLDERRGALRADHAGHRRHGRARGRGGEEEKPVPEKPTRGEVRVIRGWADALRAGRVNEAADFFAVPAFVLDGTNPRRSLPDKRARCASSTAACRAARSWSRPCAARAGSSSPRSG